MRDVTALMRVEPTVAAGIWKGLWKGAGNDGVVQFEILFETSEYLQVYPGSILDSGAVCVVGTWFQHPLLVLCLQVIQQPLVLLRAKNTSQTEN